MRDATFILIPVGIAVVAAVFVLMAGVLYGVASILPEKPRGSRAEASGEGRKD
jgi:hypothetical protein